MEEKKQRGGKRKGAGRKPILHKKKQISLYVEGTKIIKFGNEEKLKDNLYGFIDKFGMDTELKSEISFQKPTAESFDVNAAKRIMLDEPSQWQEAKPNTRKPKTVIKYISERLEMTNPDEYDKWLEELESDPYLSDKDKKTAKTGTL